MIPIKDIKVELRPLRGPTHTTYTDDFGRFKMENILVNNPTTNALLRFTLSNQEGSLVTSYQSGTNPAFAETMLDLTAPKTTANFKLQGNAPHIVLTLNNSPFGFSPSSNMQIPITRIPDLTALYHYSSLAMDFSKKSLPGKINFNLPLVVMGFSQAANQLGVAHFTLVDPKHGSVGKPGLLMPDIQSTLADDSKDLQTEIKLDVLYHEFAHFIQYEFSKTTFEIIPVLHNKLQALAPKLSDHLGYGLIDSKGSLNEAFGSFMSAVISRNVFTDPGHLKFGGTGALTFRFDVSTPTLKNDFNIETDPYNNPVGIKPNPKANFYLYDPDGPNSLYEEITLALLLWDLYDNTPKEVVKAPGSQTVRDGITISISKLLEIIISNKVITVKELYGAFQSSSLSGSEKRLINDIFTHYNICVDLNSNGQCNRKETMQSKGATAWEAHYGNIIFGYGSAKLGEPQTRP